MRTTASKSLKRPVLRARPHERIGLRISPASSWRVVGGVQRLIAVAAAAVLSACNGGTVDRHALTNDASTLDSIACEGALLAHDVARGRTTTYFAREQAEELRIQSSNFADALSKRPALASIEHRVRQKAKDAAAL